MKNKKSIVFGITSVLALCGFLLSTTPLEKASAASTTTNKAAWEFIGGGGCSSQYVSNGAEAIVSGSDTASSDAANYKALIPNGPNDQTLAQFFDLNLYDSVEVSVSVAMYNDDGSENVSAAEGFAFFFDVLDYSSWDTLLHCKVWANAGGSLNGDHSYELSLGDWSNTVNPYWIKGNATPSSQFDFKFDLTNHLQSYVGGQTGWVDLSGGNETTKTSVNSKLESCNNKIRFAVYGAGGFNSSVSVVLKSINGVSLANNDGTFDDTSGPAFIKGQNATNEGTLYPFTTYTLNESLVAYDIIRGSVSSYKTSVDGGATKVDGRTFRPTAVGTSTLTVYAYDDVGNESQFTQEITVSAHTSSTFTEWMNAEHTDSCANKYFEAKSIVLGMSSEEVSDFVNSTDENVVAARERYEAWCRANHDANPYSGSIVSLSNSISIQFVNAQYGILFVVGIILAIIVLLSVTSIVLKRKQR
ncbi:MAG: hypothetical protein ACI31G_01445 [Bacilli bacterium]